VCSIHCLTKFTEKRGESTLPDKTWQLSVKSDLSVVILQLVTMLIRKGHYNGAYVSVAAFEEIGKLGVEVVCQRDVREHSVELVGELVPAGLLQPIDHRLLKVHGVRLLMNQSFA